jgi:hypothetical protein
MTNRFKFRIWDRALNQWVEELVSGTHAFTETFIGLNGLVTKFDAGFPDREDKPLFEKQSALTYPDNLPWFAQKRYVVQQFTGLKDMDGQDIFEGDILENVVYPVKFKIEWCKERDYCGFVTINLEDGFRNLFLAKNFVNCKVVGNIFKNE